MLEILKKATGKLQSMENLSMGTLGQIQETTTLERPLQSSALLPEKVLQFGTGVLLRGLPDYFINKANNQGIFNGRVVVVKSTSQGLTDAFQNQNCLYTHCIRGLEDNKKIEENIINASISRVLSAKDEWPSVLACAANPDLQIIISNTTEVGISLVKEDKMNDDPPQSFPGKLVAFLFSRYKVFNGDASKGMVIIPTELIVDNGKKLQTIMFELAHLNNADPAFIKWMTTCNHFCNSLVDRIVPGQLPTAEKEAFQGNFNYNDELMIMSESYSLWAIETNDLGVKEKLSFYKADKGVVICEDINKYRELKLRLLNGTHTFTCALAHIAGFTTVRQAMEDQDILSYVRSIMVQEISPAIVGAGLSFEEAKAFAEKVIDRFSNPFIEHRWLSIAVQYSSKMKLRNVPVILKHYENTGYVPPLMALGFAAYILFMNCIEEEGKFTGSAGGDHYNIHDDHAHWFANHSQLKNEQLVNAVLSNINFWEVDLTALSGFPEAVLQNYLHLSNGEIKQAIKESQTNQAL